MMRFLLITICVTVVYSDVTRKMELDLCSEEIISQYKIVDPGKCISRGNSTRISPINIYKPYNNLENLGATACRKEINIHNCVHYLFGSNVCSFVRTEYQLVTQRECELANLRYFTSLGRLLPEGDNTMKTRNVLEPYYAWFGKEIKVENFIMSQLTITKNIVTEDFHHITLGRLTCNKKFKTCTAGRWRVNYVEPRERNCKTIPTTANATLLIHKTSRGNLFEIENENIIVSTLLKCTKKTTACLKPKSKSRFLCTLTNHILEIPEENNMEPMGTAKNEIPASLRDIQSTITSMAHGAFLNHEMLEDYLRIVKCEAARGNVIALMGSQSLNPSQVLSFLLEREVQAVFTGGVLKQLRCSKVQAVLQPQLYYKGHVSNRPLFMAYTGTEAILTSLRQGRFLTKRISSTITSTRKKTFNFNDTVLIYENNTLLDQKPMLNKITIKNLELQEKLIDIQEENFNEDLQNVAWSEEDITQQQLKNLLIISKHKFLEEGINIEELLEETHTMDYTNVKNMLEMIKYTCWKKIENILRFVGYVYTVAGTIFLITVTIQTIRELCSKGRQGGSNGGRNL